jgi:hypothetical protein
MVIVEDQSIESQLLQFDEDAVPGLDPFLHIPDSFFWMNEQWIKITIRMTEYEEVLMRAYIPQQMND